MLEKTSKVNVVSKEGVGNNDTGRVGIEGEEGRRSVSEEGEDTNDNRRTVAISPSTCCVSFLIVRIVLPGR